MELDKKYLNELINERKGDELYDYCSAYINGGNANAAQELSSFICGDSTPLTQNSEFAWRIVAAELGSLSAKCDLAEMYQTGTGVEKNVNLALELYNYCAEKNMSRAIYKLADYYEKQHMPETAVALYTHAAELGYQNAASRAKLVQGSIDKAKTIRLTAEQGNAKAQCDYAERCEEGKGVNKNLKEAFEWYMRSAENGSPRAQYMVGIFLETGKHGKEPAPDIAISWYMKSAKATKPYSIAFYKLYELYRDGNVVPQNIKRANTYLIKSADLCYTVAALQVARNYEYGINDFEQNLYEAARFYIKAADCNNPEARSHIDELLKSASAGDNCAQYFAWSYYSIKEKNTRSANALAMLHRSAESGYLPAVNELRSMTAPIDNIEQAVKPTEEITHTELTPQESENIEKYTNNADAGDINAQYELGMVYKDIADRAQDALMYQKATHYFKLAAEQGLPAAQFEYALCLGNAKGTKYDPHTAFLWHQKAAAGGDVRSLTSMGICYSRGKGVTPNKALAVSCFEQAVQAGDLEAKYRLAKLLSTYPHEQSRAFSLYDEAARDGHSNAQQMLGLCYEKGIGTVKDLKKALYWYNIASEGGSSSATYSLAQCYEKGIGVEQNEKIAISYYMRSAEMGNAAAASKIAHRYFTGKGLKKDPEKVFYWYLKSAESGNYKGIHSLASCYEFGIGTPRNIEKAIELYKKAAMFGNPLSKYRLALYYSSGIHTEQDYTEAIKLCKAAADCGVEQAQCKLARWYEKGFKMPQDIRKAIYLYTEAANKGDPVAQYYLGLINAEGKGMPKNISQAIELYKLSAAKNFPPAMFRLGICYEIGYGIEQDISLAYSLFKQAHLLGYEPATMELSRLMQ